MLRIQKYSLTLLLHLLCTTVFAQQVDSSEKERVLLITNEHNEVLSFLPIQWIINEEVFSANTNENGLVKIPNSNQIIRLRIPKDFGILIDDSTLIPGQTSVRILSQLSRIDPVSLTTGVIPRLLSENPYSVQIISKKTIEKMAAQHVAEVLQNQSGVLMSQDPSLGASVQLQGMGGQNVKILINGIPMIGRLNGNIDISQIPTQQIERIEIIEGPMSVVYGTDALGGVINIITKSASHAQQLFQVKTYADQRGNYNQDLALSSYNPVKGNNLGFYGFDINLGRQFFEGVDFDKSNRNMDWKPKTRWFGEAQWKYKTKTIEQTLRYSQFHEYLIDRSNAEFNLITITGYNNYFETRRRELSSITQWKWNRYNALKFQNALNFFQRDKTNVRRNLVNGLETITRPEDQDTTLNTAFNFRGLWEHQAPSKRFHSLLGYEFQSERLTSYRVRNQEPITDLALFGSLEYRPSQQWNIQPSLRTALNNTFGSTSVASLWGQTYKWVPLIPSLQLKGQISEHMNVRASYARGFRAPNAKELYFLFVDINHNVQGNPNLIPERAHNFNTSIDYRHSINKNIGATFKASGFFNRVSNQIQLALVDLQTNLYQYINVGELQTQGITAQTQVFIESWDFQSSYSLIANRSQFNEQSNVQSWIVPQGTFNIVYDFKRSPTSINLFTRFTGKTIGFRNDGNTFELSSYWMADLNITHKFWQNRLQLQLGGKNLFNVTQIQNTAAGGGIHTSQGGLNIGMGRNLFVQCIFNLNT